MTRDQAYYFFKEVEKELDIDKVHENKFNEWYKEMTSKKGGGSLIDSDQMKKIIEKSIH